MVALALVFAVIGAAAIAGLITFVVFFLVLVPLLLVLVFVLLALGNGRLRIHVMRRAPSPSRGPPHVR